MISRGRNLKHQRSSENMFLLTGLPQPRSCFDSPGCCPSALCALQPGCFSSFPQDTLFYQVHLQVCKNFFLSPQLGQGDFMFWFVFFFFPGKTKGASSLCVALF